MNGAVVGFSAQTNSGLISGEDGKFYTFAGAEWKDSNLPAPGLKVNYHVREGEAVTVYLAIGASAAGSSVGAFEKRPLEYRGSPRTTGSRRAIDEERAYEEALREVQSGTPRHGIWVKAMAHSDGEESKTRAAYLRFRAEQYLADASAARMTAVKEMGLSLVREAFIRALKMIILTVIVGSIVTAIAWYFLF